MSPFLDDIARSMESSLNSDVIGIAFAYLGCEYTPRAAGKGVKRKDMDGDEFESFIQNYRSWEEKETNYGPFTKDLLRARAPKKSWRHYFDF